jgi:hypothetical protein
MADHEFLLAALSLVMLWGSAQAGAWLRRRRGKLDTDDRDDLALVVTASLTLLGLLVGFSFLMAVSRYNQRKDCEGIEAITIRTAYIRAGLLPEAEAARVRELLKRYVEQRLRFYLIHGAQQLGQIDAKTN